MIRRLALALVALVALSVATNGAAFAQKVNIAALRLVSSGPLFVAMERGYYKAEGLEAAFTFFDAAQPVAVAIAAGDADVGVTAFTAGFFNLAGQGALQVIGAQSREEPGFDFSAYVVSNKAFAEGVTTVEKWPGHSFAMTQVGSSFHYMVGRLAEDKGFPLQRMDLKALQSLPNMTAAIKSGQIDTAIMPGNMAVALHTAGEAKLIGWVHEHTPWALGGLFTSTRNVKEKRAMLEKFVRAYQKGAKDYNAAMNARDASGRRVFGPDADAVIAIIQKYTQSTPDAIRGSAPYIDPAGRLDVGDVHRQVSWYQKQGLVENSVDPAKFIDLTFIQGHMNVPRR